MNARRYIPFNKTHIAGRELYYVAQAVEHGEIKGDGPFTEKCALWFQEKMGVPACLLTHSCTGALEMAALLLNIQEGDEVILPSYTFASTANAFALRGARLMFAEISERTLNIDPDSIESLISVNTKAICIVHYAGVACDMQRIRAVAERYAIPIIEDAAHGVMAKIDGRYLGTLGDLATFSFHETKNYCCGEGGALLINNPQYVERAEILREKGTNRSQFFRGEIDKYTWVDIGSSFLPSELTTAYLFGQLERAEEINNERLRLLHRYYNRLEDWAISVGVRLPHVPDNCEHNAHMFYLVFPDLMTREAVREYLHYRGCSAVFHYIPLHSSPAGIRFGNNPNLPITDRISDSLLRLPLFCGLTDSEVDFVCDSLMEAYSNLQK